MRIAILSALAESVGQAEASAGERPAFRRFAGKSVLYHQIDCAAHLGCERIICLSGASGPDMAGARGYAVRAGLRFEVAENLLRLVGAVTADDDVIVLADGLLPDCPALHAALGERAGVAAFAAEPAIGLGFERIDADRAWSGALRMRGAHVASLADLPPDCDLASSLLRIALQAGVRVVTIDQARLAEGTWQRHVQRHAAADLEKRWLNRQVQPAPFTAPGLALADRMAMRWAQDAGAARWARAPHLIAVALGAAAVIAGVMSWPLPGLGLLLVASFAFAVSKVFDRIETLGAPPRKPRSAMSAGQGIIDALLVVLLTLVLDTTPEWLRLALPLMMIAALRLGARNSAVGLRALHSDRVVLLAVLLAGASQGWAASIVVAITLMAIGGMLWASRAGQGQITAD